MEDALLLIVMAAFFVFCYFVAVRLGRFTDVWYRQMRRRLEEEKKARVLLTGEKNTAEITAEIESFRERAGRNTAVILLSEDSDLYESFVRLADPADDDSR